MTHRRISILLVLSLATAVSGFSQALPSKPSMPPPAPVAAPSAVSAPFARDGSVLTTPDVNLSMCVNSAKLTVNSWSRNEIRVYVGDGSKFAFKVLERDKQTSKPAWVAIVASGQKPSVGMMGGECLSAEHIELDVPAGTTLKLKGKTASVSIDSISRVGIDSLGGDIELRGIANGISAKVYSGDISIEDSFGVMQIETTTGNNIVYEAGPSQSGDTFLAKASSGTISLQKLNYRQIEAGSISGSIIFGGSLITGGTYRLQTSNGSLRVSLPPQTKCQVAATYGYGNFASEFPVKIVTENIQEGQIKRIVGEIGGTGGEAELRLSTTTGSISIKKQPDR